MNALGCLMFVVIMACLIAFFFVAAMWIVVGTIMLLFKLIWWMAYCGAVFIVIGLVCWLINRVASRFR